MFLTPLTTLLGIRLPVIQAPMAGIDTPELAATVANTGGLGSISVGTISAEQARARIRETRRLTAKPFNVNVFAHDMPQTDEERERAWIEWLAPYFDEVGAALPTELYPPYGSFNSDDALFHMLLDEAPPIVSFHFGLPESDKAQELQKRGIILLACATNVVEAQQALALGMQAIIAQGFEAGGHRGSFQKPYNLGEVGSMALLPQIVDAVDCPVIAAGGIGDGRGIAAALALGAAGVQLGTAFITCPESAASSQHRELLLHEDQERTRVTTVISGRPARGVYNRLMEEADNMLLDVPDYPVAYAASKILAEAGARAGNSEFGIHWAGQAAALNRAIGAAELVRALWRETIDTLDRLQRQRAI